MEAGGEKYAVRDALGEGEGGVAIYANVKGGGGFGGGGRRGAVDRRSKRNGWGLARAGGGDGRGNFDAGVGNRVGVECRQRDAKAW